MKADQLKTYVHDDDPELDRWMSEISLRAIAQIGKISRELEKAKANQYMPLPTAGKKHRWHFDNDSKPL